MSGEAPKIETGWTVDQLKEYLDRVFAERAALAATQTQILRDLYDARICAVETEMRTQFRATHEAVDKAEEAQQIRNESMNEFRGQLRDQAQTFPTRIEVDARLVSIEQRLARAERDIISMTGRREGRTGVTGPMWAGVIALAVALISALVISLTGRNAERLNNIERDLPPPAATRPK